MDRQQARLTASDLTIGYVRRGQPTRVVASNLNLSLQPGQLVCLLGPNGAGKSTLMRTLSGLQPALSGHVYVDAQSLTTLSPVALARKLSLVLAERVESGTMLVQDLVALGRMPYTNWLGNLSAHDKEKVQSALQATNTLSYRHRQVQQLSDGERQQVMLARALAQDTAFIIMDEPTAHLDLPNRVMMMQLLHQLTRQASKAILVSTHELDLALQAADQLWLLDRQGNLLIGAPEDLVLSGAFEATFDKQGFSFDRATGTFTMHTKVTGPPIGLAGDAGLLFWTRRALLRKGFALSTANDAVCVVEMVKHNNQARWHYVLNDQSYYFTSIAGLLASLQVLKQSFNQKAVY